ncbi:hypothetical protein PR202_gb25172 [Eleusine coracana subsp. coracana]|uniref:Replication factor A C-terminal domain-containing protein n=1 Tax=Eleusine coracana subsp. coracana TaxID=191504 RepID=A0AAV5FNL9_ELECO|nr:hypothetical protein QOZ80_5BG0456390 [Eleusine coracana subsp. coracana]GJN36323.1 hypothetical protein PR202_gb25172 [Eleusine coracana subsp. coracana]
MEAALSRGAVAAISASPDGMNPVVLQVAELRVVNPSGGTKPRYRMELSDGVVGPKSLLVGLLAAPLHHLVDDGKIGRGTVIRLLEYYAHNVRNRRIFIFVNFEILQTDCAMIDYREGIAENCGESHSAPQGIEAACPLVVNGRQCLMEVTSNGDGWWHCHNCYQTFVTCDYSYRILVQLQDSTGMTYVPGSQQVGEDIFGRTAKELYLMKCEKQEQFHSIVQGVLFHEFLFKLKVESGAINDKRFPKCTMVKAERVNPSNESRCLLREINKLLQKNSGSAVAHRPFAGYGMGFSCYGASFSCDPWDLGSRTGSISN